MSHRDAFRINSGSEEGGLPSVHVLLTLTGQLQLTVVLVNVPVDTVGSVSNTAHQHAALHHVMGDGLLFLKHLY